MLQMMSVIAELERNLLADRVRKGIEASKKRGVAIGRPKNSTRETRYCSSNVQKWRLFCQRNH